MRCGPGSTGSSLVRRTTSSEPRPRQRPRQWTTVLTGGPGTGKTTTVAGLLALLAEQAELAGERRPWIALTAPTGKAAARLEEAVRGEMSDRLSAQDTERLGDFHARTLHMLLGRRPDSSTRFRHHRDNRLPHDIVVVDETSMVSLTMMARLLEAVRPDARLVLVGDPDQLASIEAGAVLADLVDGLVAGGHGKAAELRTSHRFGSEIGDLALAVREDRPDDVLDLLRSGNDRVTFVEDDDPRETLRSALLPDALAIRAAAEAGDADAALRALDRHRLLCAHRDGPWGVTHWNRTVERWITEETEDPLWDTWYVGRPVLVTANDYGLGIYNGDVGVTVRRPDGSLRVCIASTRGRLDFAPGRLGNVETLHAMTIHKAQGSQATEVTVLLPSRRLPPPHPRTLLHRHHPRPRPSTSRRNRARRTLRPPTPRPPGNRPAAAAARRRRNHLGTSWKPALTTRSIARQATSIRVVRPGRIATGTPSAGDWARPTRPREGCVRSRSGECGHRPGQWPWTPRLRAWTAAVASYRSTSEVSTSRSRRCDRAR